MVSPVIIFLFGLSNYIGLFDQILQPCNRFLLVGVLASLLGADHSLSSGQVDCTDTCLDLIDILTAFAAAAEGVEDYLLRVELFHLGDRTGAEINKPILALVLRTIWAAANPLDRAKVGGEVGLGEDPHRPEGALVISGRRINNRNIIVRLKIGQQFGHAQLTFSWPLA